MLDLSWAEIGIILVTATFAIGPKELPVVLRKAGRAWAQFKRFTADIKRQFDQSPLGAELRAAQEEVERESRIIYDEHGMPYETFSLDGIRDASRATPILPKPIEAESTIILSSEEEAAAAKPADSTEKGA